MYVWIVAIGLALLGELIVSVIGSDEDWALVVPLVAPVVAGLSQVFDIVIEDRPSKAGRKALRELDRRAERYRIVPRGRARDEGLSGRGSVRWRKL